MDQEINQDFFFLKGAAPETFSKSSVQQVVIPRAYSFLFLQHHNHVCSAEKAYGLQIFILFTCWVYCCIQSKHKSLGILLFFFLFLFSLFVWLSECSCGQTGLFSPRMISNAPMLPKSKGAATLRKSYIWKWGIYKASLLLFSLQCCISV